MKKFLLLFSLLFVALTFYRCGEGVSSDNKDLEKIVLKDRRISQEEIIIQDNNGDAILSADDQELFLTYINNQLRKEMDVVVNIKIESIEKPGTKNLIFYLKDSSSRERIPFAFVLEQNNLRSGSPFFSNGDSHSCAGAPCNCCAFKRNGLGEITGCECNGSFWASDNCTYESGQKCNHTVTSG